VSKLPKGHEIRENVYGVNGGLKVQRVAG